MGRVGKDHLAPTPATYFPGYSKGLPGSIPVLLVKKAISGPLPDA